MFRVESVAILIVVLSLSDGRTLKNNEENSILNGKVENKVFDNLIAKDSEVEIPMNIVQVPIQCPEGQKPGPDGKCKEIWLSNRETGLPSSNPRNVIVAPINCPPGQQLGPDGRCRYVWRNTNADLETQNIYGPYIQLVLNVNVGDVLTAPVNCLPGQVAVADDTCTDVWTIVQDSIKDRRIVNVPMQCPIGYKLDRGVCRRIW